VEILRMPKATPSMGARALEMMERQLSQMVRLVDDLLDVSRITTGKLAVRRAPMQLQEALRDAVETVRSFIESRDQQLVLDIAPDPLMVDGDRTRLAQVFANLLNNAGKYTDVGGRIEVSLRRDGDTAVMCISDNGIGLDDRALGAIFDMFVQVDHSLTRTQAGLGVGLSLARRLVALHDGTLSAESEGLGKGSRFTVRLPVSGTTQALPAITQPSARRAAACRILVADDNMDFANSLAALLASQGHEVRTVHDGAQALRAAEEFVPDIAFIDIGMPKVHGYEVARRFKAEPRLSDCIVVAVTGWGQEDDRRRARDAGFDRLMVKPVSAGDIQAVVAELSRAGAPAPEL
jgi:CheY-like chemotaxis protein